MPMNFVAYYASVPSHSPYYPTHSPHHRPVPFAHITFPPDPPYSNSDVEPQSRANPTHGQEVTTGPVGCHDSKLKDSAVTKESMITSSLRSGDAFSTENPTMFPGTFATGLDKSGNIHTIYGKKSDTPSPGGGGGTNSRGKPYLD